MLIHTYQHVLNPQLANKIMYSTDKPSTLKDMGKDTTLKKGWYSIVAQYLGLYKPTIMFFGLCNSSLTFQAMMNDTLKDKIKEGFCIVYMDNILIFTKNKEDLECFTKHILKSL